MFEAKLHMYSSFIFLFARHTTCILEAFNAWHLHLFSKLNMVEFAPCFHSKIANMPANRV